MLQEYFKVFAIVLGLVGVFLFTREQGEEECRIDNHHSPARLRTVGLVLARGGSKGIPLKNLAVVGNDTLLGRTLKTLARFREFEEVWVSTDSERIGREAEKNGALVHWRSPASATDSATSLDGVSDFLTRYTELDIVALVQCTSPFLSLKYLEEGFGKMKEGYDSVFTVTRQHKLRWKMQNGQLVSDNFDVKRRPRRQDWQGELVENGMLYFFKKQVALSCNRLQGGRIGFVEVSAKDSLEIDTHLDLQMASAIAKTED